MASDTDFSRDFLSGYVLSTLLRSLNFTGSETACTYMHSLGRTVHLALNSLDICFPHCVGLSIRMAYIMTEKNALATNITLSHFDTSSTPRYPTLLFCS